jgi:hypothetical protein
VKPLFILAPPRSFTSVTCAMIGAHPDMFGLPETNLFVRETYGEMAALYRARPPFQQGLLRAFAELTFGEQSDENINVVKVWLEQQAGVTTRSLFEDLVAFAAPRELVEKSPLHVYKLENLQRMRRAFPDARYLHLTRHPRGTCESIAAQHKQWADRVTKMRSRIGPSGDGPQMLQPVLTPERMWLEPHLTIVDFLAQVPDAQTMRLRGEDLLTSPDRYLAEIAEWLGISRGKNAIAAMKHPETSPFARPGPPSARFGNDPSFLEAPELRPYRPKFEDLEGSLSFDAKVTFSDEVKAMAALLGY